MSFGVDTLGALIEKLKQLINETQNHYESFFDSTQLFKQGKMDNKEYFTRMGEYLVSSSALNFLACRLILEMKSAIDKTGSTKTSSTSSSHPSTYSTVPRSGNGGSIGTSGSFGIDGFVGLENNTRSANKGYDLPMPQESPPSFKPVNIPLPKHSSPDKKELKNCIICGASIPKHAKFCNKCGNSQ